MKKFTLEIEFRDEDDLNSFCKYVRMAKEKDGTVGGLYAGLLCSALKRAEIVAPNMREAIGITLDTGLSLKYGEGE